MNTRRWRGVGGTVSLCLVVTVGLLAHGLCARADDVLARQAACKAALGPHGDWQSVASKLNAQGTIEGINPPGAVPPQDEQGANRRNILFIDKVQYELTADACLFRHPARPILFDDLHLGDRVAFTKDSAGMISTLWLVEASLKSFAAPEQVQARKSETTPSQTIIKEGSVWKNQ